MAAATVPTVFETLRSVVRFERLETDPVERRLRRAASVADLRRIAKRRLPGGVFDYIDGAAEDERTLAANERAFAAATFRPRVLRGITQVDIASSLLGAPLAYPLVLAPTGFTRIADPQGELAVARAAGRARLPYTLSTLSTRSIEEVRAVSDGRLWFQVYAWRDRAMVKEMVDRAAAARYEALVLTVDTAVLGRRERDVRRGFSLPPSIGPRTLIDGALHPGWTWAFVRSDPIRFANVLGRDVGDGASPVSLSDYINTQFDPALSWPDVEWLRSIWDGPIVLKGIQTVDDALHRRRQRGGRDRALEPWRAPTRRRARTVLARRTRGRRGRRSSGDHLRRRRAARQRHREGPRRGRAGMHGRPRVSLRAGRRR